MSANQALRFLPLGRPAEQAVDTAQYGEGIIGNSKLYQSSDDVLFEAGTSVFVGDFVAHQSSKRKRVLAEPWKEGITDVVPQEHGGFTVPAEANAALGSFIEEAGQKGLSPLDLAKQSLNEAFGELNVLLNLLPLIKGHSAAVTLSAGGQQSHVAQQPSLALFDRSTIVGNPPPASWFTRQGERMLGYKQMQLESASGLLGSAAARLESFSRQDYAECLLSLEAIGESKARGEFVSDWLVGMPRALIETAVDASLLMSTQSIAGKTVATTFKAFRSSFLEAQTSSSLLAANAFVTTAREQLLSYVLARAGQQLSASVLPHLLCIPPASNADIVAFLLEKGDGDIAQLLAPCVLASGTTNAAGVGSGPPTNQIAITSKGLQRMLAAEGSAETDSGAAALTLLYPHGHSGARRQLAVMCHGFDSGGSAGSTIASEPTMVDIAGAMASRCGYVSVGHPSASTSVADSLAGALASVVVEQNRSGGGRPITRVEAQVFELVSYHIAEAAWKEYRASAGASASNDHAAMTTPAVVGTGKLGPIVAGWLKQQSRADGGAVGGALPVSIWLQ
jgi:hypothetical protein